MAMIAKKANKRMAMRRCRTRELCKSDLVMRVMVLMVIAGAIELKGADVPSRGC